MSTIQPWEISDAQWREVLIRTTLRQWIDAVKEGKPLSVRRGLAQRALELKRLRNEREVSA